MRTCIIRYMQHISQLIITSEQFDRGDDIEAYKAATKMNQMDSYGTHIEMLTLSHTVV